jgi:hypothetical protein
VLLAAAGPAGSAGGQRIVEADPGRAPAVARAFGVAALIVGWLPVLELLVRRRRDVTRLAGTWPVRTAVIGALLIPVGVVAGRAWHGVRGLWILGVAVTVLGQGWALAALWRRPGRAGRVRAGG